MNQESDDFELIISDDHSNDNTASYLHSLDDNRIRTLHTTEQMSMAEHWEWALMHAVGEWLIFVGQDDGLQPYFFELADNLTILAKKRKIRVIMSRRAYYFWPGCETIYGNVAVNFGAEASIKILNSRIEGLKTLLGMQNYFELPAMYTTSLFHRSLIEEAKYIQGGRLFVTHPQDANLAAIACSLEKRYIYSNMPLGWVGSSPKSAGLAVVAETNDETIALKREYLDKIERSRLLYSPYIGDFWFGSTTLYFWGAMMETRRLRGNIINFILGSKSIRKIVLASTLMEMRSAKRNNLSSYLKLFEIIVKINTLTLEKISSYAENSMPRILKAFQYCCSIANSIKSVKKKIRGKIWGSHKKITYNYYASRSKSSEITIEEAQQNVKENG